MSARILEFKKPPHVCKLRSRLLGIPPATCEWCAEHARRKERTVRLSRWRGYQVRHPVVKK